MVNVYEISSIIKGSVFKTVLTDMIYSFRMSIKKLTGVVTDIKLDRISFVPFNTYGETIVINITNIIGGCIGCCIDSNLINFLHNYTGFDIETVPLIFATDFFDCFECTSRNKWLTLDKGKPKKVDNFARGSSYYIRFSIRIKTEEKEVITSKFIIIIDEIASLYFMV